MKSLQNQTSELSFEKVWLMFQETNKKFQETDKKFQESERMLTEKFQETDKKMKETNKQIKELGKQIGGLGNKFGTFNEGLLMPSLMKTLEEQFGCKRKIPNYDFSDNGNSFEIDILGVSESACYIVEIKSHLNDEAIKQTIKNIELFRKYEDIFNEKTCYGIIVATHYNKNTVKKVMDKGLYFISTADNLIKIDIPEGFKPKAW